MSSEKYVHAMILQIIAPIIQQIEIIYFFIIPTLLKLVIANSFLFILTDLKIFFYSNCSFNSYKIFFRGFFTQVSSSGFLSAVLPLGIHTIFLCQILRCSFFCHGVVRKDNDLICSGYGTHPVAITRTVLSAIRRERAVCIRVSFSTSREAVASSKRMIGAFFRNARAMEIRWRSPPESSQPFSPILVCHPSGSFLANSSTLASFAAAMTCSSVASLFPIRIFSRIVLSNSVTS